MFKVYYYLTKPGIIYGNALPAIAGFLLASHDYLPVKLFAAMIIGLSLVIASGCVFNNIADKDIDSKMDRTKNRELVTGQISKTTAIIFGVILIILGCLILSLFTNRYSLTAGLIGFVVYVFLYTPLKRKTSWATLVGAIAGATPPVVGYMAVTNRFDAGAVILFLILLFWQMPHFFAIAIYRIKDYRQARIPVLPVAKGVKTTKTQMLLYIIGFIIVAAMLKVFGYVGYLYLGVLILLGLIWLWFAIQGFGIADDAKWARKMFLFSLITLTSLCVIIPVDVLIK